MTFARRGRPLAVSGFLLAGTIGIISSTQTWLTVERADAGAAILVPGASALVLLAPISLAVLALGAALSIAARPLRVIFAVLAAAAALLLGWQSLQIFLIEPLAAVAPTVAEHTGLAGSRALADIVQSIVPSAWPAIALGGWVLLLAAALIALLTWRGWKAGGRRYRTAADSEGKNHPVDAYDSWDDLSRGTDPTR